MSSINSIQCTHNAVHCIAYLSWRSTVSRSKEETLSIRTSKEIKLLLKAAAEKEHRSQASMIEILILDYAKSNGLSTIMASDNTK